MNSERMFSGSDSTESQNYTQWPLNASAYQSMQNEQVDWAALANQWIKMKEAGPPPMPEKTLSAPPPPIISAPAHTTKGEAPMDVENDSDMGSDSNDDGVQCFQSGSWNNWSSSGSAWPPAISSIPLNKAPLLPTPAYNTFSTNSNVKEETFSSGNSHWTGNGSPNARTSGAAPRVMKPHNKRFSKVNVPLKTPPLPPHIGPNTGNDASPPIIDANKRKQLPAWIREGLEKMERDKMKQMDKYRVRDKADDLEEEKKKLREDALEILKSTARVMEKRINIVSEFKEAPHLDESDNEPEEAPVPPPAPQITQKSVPMTHEEMMLKVRRTMTEILLKVTNREIAQICKEEQQRHVRKLKAIDQHVTAPSAGANLSARLGLGAYGSGESSDESGGEEEKNEVDSDNELRDTIRRRKEEFEKTEREIEQRLADADPDKEETSKSRRESPESDDSSKPSKASPPEKSQDRRSQSPKSSRKSSSKRSVPSRPSSNSRSTSRSTSSSADRRSRHARRRRSPIRRRRDSRSRSRSRSSRSGRSYRTDQRRRARRSRSRSQSRSRRRSRRRSRSRTRSHSHSRSYDGGRGLGSPSRR